MFFVTTNNQYIIFSRYISKIYYFNITLLDQCISYYTKLLVCAQGSILWNIAPRECTVKYFPPREGSTENEIFQFHTSFEDNSEIIILFYSKFHNIRIMTRFGIYGKIYLFFLEVSSETWEGLYLTVYPSSHPNMNTIQHRLYIRWLARPIEYGRSVGQCSILAVV